MYRLGGKEGGGGGARAKRVGKPGTVYPCTRVSERARGWFSVSVVQRISLRGGPARAGPAGGVEVF